MEKYTMFMDRKNQYSEDEYTTQSNLQIQCNPYQATSHIGIKNFLIYFWLHWVFVAARWLSLVVQAGAILYCSVQASHCGGFSCCRAPALEALAQ